MKAKVLVVDDQASVRSVVRAYLETVRECSVVEASDGIDAVKKLIGATFDVVITDLVMPGMSGLELLGTIRRDRRLKAVPVILLTSQNDEKERHKAQALGLNGYLLKPFDPRTMKPLLDKLLGPSQ